MKKNENLSKLTLLLQVGTFIDMEGKTHHKSITKISQREFELFEMFADVEVQEDLTRVYILNKCRFTIGFNYEPTDLF